MHPALGGEGETEVKRGDTVAVCYDGKWARREKGVVVKTHNGHHITVQFKLYALSLIHI